MRALILVVIASTLACAGKPPEITEYLLRSDRPGAATVVETTQDVFLASVHVAAYLRRAGIVVEVAPGQLRPAHGHRWAEPLAEGVRTLLRAELSLALGVEISADPGRDRADALHVLVRVERLHGTLDGTALIEADYRIERGSDVAEYRFAATEPLIADGYPGLVDAQRRLVGRLARAMSEAIAAAGR